ncbi:MULTISPECIES: hypothetical protein [unclassified Butyrivibrio]|uniref:hypothetical protein n=1 Tax=unclassified Butyrivibrio TaxID=2639466 RepID=UPI0003B7543C|nr:MULTISPECIES: hypothetical protein [unclassified Butyrivibrio]SEL69445.1 hypothetical protein SAMN04487770_11540 [Butyrivibrio sp. ob235]
MVKINKKLATFTALAIMMSLVMAPSVRVLAANQMTGTVKTSASEPAAGTVTEETTVEISPEVDAMTLDELVAYTDELLKSSCDDDESSGYNLRTYDDRIVVEMWYTGMNDLVKLAAIDETYQPTWDYMVEAMRDISETLYAAYKKYDRHVYVILLDETDPEEHLIACKNGKVTYDFLHPER